MPREIRIIGLQTVPEVRPGDDLARLILDASKREDVGIEDGDIVIVAQKVVSKAEGRFVWLKDVIPSDEAKRLAEKVGRDPRLVEVILNESTEIVKAERGYLITRTKHGIVCANAGVDHSNVLGRDDVVLLLPKDPDTSAERIRSRLKELTGKVVGVLITDTYGRPLREGQINMAIGIAGVKPFKDYRGTIDSMGYLLRVKNIAVADELASAAELIMGQARERIPVAIVKGLGELVTIERMTAKNLNMPKERWLFR